MAVSARGLIVAFEAKLQNAQRAFTLLLWIGRTTFVICLGLFTAAVVRAVLGHFAIADQERIDAVVAAAVTRIKDCVPDRR